jgi:hypothetical protein
MSVPLFAQEENILEEQVYENYPTTIPDKLSSSIEGDFKIPTPLRNEAFDKIANGIADINLLYQYPVLKKFSVGLGFKYNYYQFRDFISNNTFANSGKLFNYAPFGRLSFIKFSNPRLFWQISAKAGYSFMQFNSYTCTAAGEKSHDQSTFFLEPQIGAHLFVDESLSFSLIVSNYFGFGNFNSGLMCLPNFAGLSEEDSIGNYSMLGIGFGFTYFFNKKALK